MNAFNCLLSLYMLTAQKIFTGYYLELAFRISVFPIFSLLIFHVEALVNDMFFRVLYFVCCKFSCEKTCMLSFKIVGFIIFYCIIVGF